MTNKFKAFTALAIAAVILTGVLVFSSPSKSFAKDLDSNITQMMDLIASGSKNDLKTQLSGNPYDYTIDNKYFNNIVAMGSDALPYLEDYITKSPTDGLTAYMLAIAVEKITQTDLKNADGKKYQWTTAKEFIPVFQNHLKAVPQKIKEILNSKETEEMKIEKITKLGTPAIPFVIEDADPAHQKIVSESLKKLCSDSTEMPYDSNISVKDWSDKNKTKLNALKKYISEKAK